MSTPSTTTPTRVAVIGYGGAFNMGKGHLNWMKDAGMVPTAVCDMDASRLTTADEDFPGIATYTSVEELLKNPDVDLVTIITPHDSHARLATQAAEAGKHVVVEKPMCITSAEATQMIDAAKKAGVVLSVFHNRRHDGDFLAIKDVITKGYIGDVFDIQAGGGNFGHPGTWWRSNKAISGGLMYDWGAHFIDWILNLKPGHKVTQVTGILHHKVWTDQTNEDHGKIIIRFDDQSTAELTQSRITAAPMPKWRILGTSGAILDDGSVKEGFKIFRVVDGQTLSGEVKNQKTEWNTYYKDLAAHINGDAPLSVTPESARRIIAVIEAAEKSAKSGRSEAVPFED
jgi:scyllo-inositol 2-dehydrogenase (NADP+)